MLAGIVFQLSEASSASGLGHTLTSATLVSIVIYVICATEFLIRYSTKRPVIRFRLGKANDGIHGSSRLDARVKLMLVGLSFSTVCIFIRSVTLRIPGAYHLPQKYTADPSIEPSSCLADGTARSFTHRSSSVRFYSTTHK